MLWEEFLPPRAVFPQNSSKTPEQTRLSGHATLVGPKGASRTKLFFVDYSWQKNPLLYHIKRVFNWRNGRRLQLSVWLKELRVKSREIRSESQRKKIEEGKVIQWLSMRNQLLPIEVKSKNHSEKIKSNQSCPNKNSFTLCEDLLEISWLSIEVIPLSDVGS